LRRRIDGQRKRAIPRRDDANNAQRPVMHDQLLEGPHERMSLANLVGQISDRARAPMIDRIACGNDFNHECFGTGLAGILPKHVDDLSAMLDQAIDRAPDDARTLCHRYLGPFLLSCLRAHERYVDVLLRVDGDFMDGLVVRRASKAETAAAV
jgi:hypothetical protein